MAIQIRAARKGEETALARVRYLANKNVPGKLFSAPGHADPALEDWIIDTVVPRFRSAIAKELVVVAENADGCVVGYAEWIMPKRIAGENATESSVQVKIPRPPLAGFFDTHRRMVQQKAIDELQTKYSFRDHILRNGIAVLPDYQGQGIGKQLTEYVSQINNEQGLPIDVIALSGAARVNTRCGYQTLEEVKIEDSRPGHEAFIVMYAQRWQAKSLKTCS